MCAWFCFTSAVCAEFAVLGVLAYGLLCMAPLCASGMRSMFTISWLVKARHFVLLLCVGSTFGFDRQYLSPSNVLCFGSLSGRCMVPASVCSPSITACKRVRWGMCCVCSVMCFSVGPQRVCMSEKARVHENICLTEHGTATAADCEAEQL
jgi:hypothetical protein